MPNKLIHEQSPYLLQHAHNPVNWYPWGDEAFEIAKIENKPVIVSIGYAACHWCHVMEHESFENEEIAAYMNAHFVCIKVDREEHPGVDHFYMDAVQAITGQGGWPLNAFVTPERVPFFGGTYYPPRPAHNRPSWIQVLERISDIWLKQKDEVDGQAEQMLAYLKNTSISSLMPDGDVWDIADCRKAADNLLAQSDKVDGGFGSAPKFPGTMAIGYLLEHYHFTGYQPALKQALVSIDAMISGGIYDQIGGGFARYSTDRKWLVPHFEKMLYDNALLISVLCDGYAISKNERYKKIVEETIAFVERELMDISGLYYSAIDADSEGEEGKFYTWNWNDWLTVLDKNDEIVAAYFGVTEQGNWEGTNILHVAKSFEIIASQTGKNIDEIIRLVEQSKKKLFAHRSHRVRPLTDDKCLLSWNALMNIAMSKAGVVFGNEKYLLRARTHMQCMLQLFQKDGSLQHVWKNNIARIPANLDDYAYLIHAMLYIGSATCENEWIEKSIVFIEIVLKDFAQEKSNYFYYTPSSQNDIPVRKVDRYDGATPSANSLMSHNLILAGMCMQKYDWVEQGNSMLLHIAKTALQYPSSFAYWAKLIQHHAVKAKIVVCSGPKASEIAKDLHMQYLPHAFIVTSEKEIFDLPIFKDKFFKDQIHIFVCTQEACLQPVNNIHQALSAINY